jgi:Tol biopolymer transport system component
MMFFGVPEIKVKFMSMIRNKFLFVFICVGVLASGCAGQIDEVIEGLSTPTVVISSPSSITPPTLEPTWTIQPTILPTEVPSPTPDSIRILSEGEGMDGPGPWLVFHTYFGMWVVDPDGGEAGFMPLVEEDGIITVFPSPQSGLLAIIKSHPYELNVQVEVIFIKDFRLFLDLDLLDYDGEALSFDNEFEAETFEWDRIFAVGKPPMWSSEGDKLAFVGSHLGPSPDVYVYDVLTGEVKRLTSGPAHATNLYWSPDDEYIFHAGVKKMYIGASGGGDSGWTFYSAKADGSGVITVFEGMEDQGYENVVGWFSDRKVLMDSGYWHCGRFDFRMVDIESGARVSIWPDQYDHIAYDSIDKVALIWVMPEPVTGEDCGSKGESGLFLVSVPDGSREKVVGIEVVDIISSLKWSEESQNFIVDLYGSWALVNPEGEVELLDGKPVFSPDGEMTALLSADKKDLNVVDKSGRTIEVVADGDILYPTWSPDGASLFFFERSSGGDFYDLYKATGPDFEPVLILEEVLDRHSDAPVWLIP